MAVSPWDSNIYRRGSVDPPQHRTMDMMSSPGSDAGHSVQGGLSVQHMPSSKVHLLAGDIAQLEHRCTWLESRNVWLTKKLMLAQRRFIEKVMMSCTRVRARKSFDAWKDAMREMRLERQLEEQTRSLDRCQRVAKELGVALTQEQSARVASEAARRAVDEELGKTHEDEARLKGQLAKGSRHLQLLETWVREAESCLIRTRSAGQSIVNGASDYEQRRRELDQQVRSKANCQHVSPVEHGMRTREEAHGVMQRVSSLLSRPGSESAKLSRQASEPGKLH